MKKKMIALLLCGTMLFCACNYIRFFIVGNGCLKGSIQRTGKINQKFKIKNFKGNYD